MIRALTSSYSIASFVTFKRTRYSELLAPMWTRMYVLWVLCPLTTGDGHWKATRGERRDMWTPPPLCHHSPLTLPLTHVARDTGRSIRFRSAAANLLLRVISRR